MSYSYRYLIAKDYNSYASKKLKKLVLFNYSFCLYLNYILYTEEAPLNHSVALMPGIIMYQFVYSLYS